MNLTFLGGAGTVTGSKILFETGYSKILIDCGLFQGLKELRLKNWSPLPFNIAELDAVLLTHAHLDHSGFLPILTQNGFKGSIFCTQASKELTRIILLDSAKIQEEDAKSANKNKYSKHPIAKPLYTIADAEKTIPFLKPIKLNTWQQLTDSIKFQFKNSGHILGSAFIELVCEGKTFIFSGDIGRKEPILLPKYTYPTKADYLVIESTYGSRNHHNISIIDSLLRYINITHSKGGILLIPSFSVERAQEIIYLLSILKEENKLPNIPIYLDSPMGVNATMVYLKHTEDHKLSENEINTMLKTVHLIKDIEHSKEIVQNTQPKIVIAGSGMLTGGRVLHYLDKIIEDEKNSILITGFQAEGTRGRALVSKDPEIKFFGNYYKIKAEVFKINDFSGHADQSELLDWVHKIENPPVLTFINHGEPHQSQALKTKINATLNWKCTVAKLNNSYYLD